MNGIIKCVETGFEYRYSDIETKEYIILNIIMQGYSWNDRPICDDDSLVCDDD